MLHDMGPQTNTEAPLSQQPVTPSAPQPVVPPVMSPASPSVAAKPPRQSPVLPLKIAGIVALVLLVGASLFGAGYVYGKKAAPPPANAMTAALSLPAGATVTSQCTQGLGTQYIAPQDIPYGPLYDVYQGKVIGLEYMVPETAPASSMNTAAGSVMNGAMSTLDLHGVAYDHMNMMIMPQGHAGLPVPHFMADILTVPKSTTDKITCQSTTSSTSSSMSM